MEWRIDNFSCWNADVHGEKISCPRVLSRFPSELYPKGLGGRLEARLLGGRAGDLFFLGPDGNPICTRLVNGDGEQPPGPTFEEIVKKIGPRDRLTLLFRCSDVRKQLLSSVIDVFDASVEVDPEALTTTKGPQEVSCFDFPGNKKFKSFCVSFTDGNFELTPSLASKGTVFSFESKILVRSRVSVLESGGSVVVSYDEREKVYRDDTTWVISDPIDVHQLHSKGLTLLLTFKVIPGSVTRGLGHLSFTPGGATTLPEVENSISKDLMSLYQDEEFADFRLNCGGVSFPTHKAILGSRSPVFRRLLLSDMKESASGSVDIEDLDPDTLSLFLSFLYSGKLLEEDSSTRSESALKLYYAADKYQVPTLKTACSEVLCSDVSVSNVCDVLSLADRHQDGRIASAARQFVARNYDAVVASDEWKRFEDDEPTLAWDTLAFCVERKHSLDAVVGKPSIF